MSNTEEEEEVDENSIPDSPDSPDADTSRPKTFHPRATKCLFIGNLPADVTKEEVERLYAKYGQIEKLDIKRISSNTNYCLLYYTNVISTLEAMQSTHRLSFRGLKLHVAYTKSSPSASIWLGTRSEAYSPSLFADDHLLEYVREYGHVKSYVLSRDCRQALVNFDSIEAARRAVEGLRELKESLFDVDFASQDFIDYFLLLCSAYEQRPKVRKISWYPVADVVLTDPRGPRPESPEVT